MPSAGRNDPAAAIIERDTDAGAPHQVIGELRPEGERSDLGKEYARDDAQVEHRDRRSGSQSPRRRVAQGQGEPEHPAPEK